MLRDVFLSVTGFENFGMVSMFVFVVFFILVLIHTYSMKKQDVESFSRIPFEESLKDLDNN